jgi:hypothetical protein
MIEEGMPKRKALEEIFSILGLYTNWPSKKVSVEQYLDLISKPEYNLKDLGLCAQSISVLNKKILPNRNSGAPSKICNALLMSCGCKCCARCFLVFDQAYFSNNKARSDGKEVYCKNCFNDLARDYRRFQQSVLRAKKLKRSPNWANVDKIKEFYINCPVGSHVDHIIPLNGELVSGLHVDNNLQYLSAIENIQKSNKFTPG